MSKSSDISSISVQKSPLSDEAALVARLKQLMSARKFTIKKLSDQTEIPYRTLQSYVQGKHTIPAVTLAKCARTLGVGVDWLLSGQPAVLDRKTLKDCLQCLEEFRAEKEGTEWSGDYYASQFEILYRHIFKSNNSDLEPEEPSG